MSPEAPHAAAEPTSERVATDLMTNLLWLDMQSHAALEAGDLDLHFHHAVEYHATARLITLRTGVDPRPVA